MSFALNNILVQNEIQISEVLALCYAVSNENGDGVFTLLELYGQAGVVCALQTVKVTNHDCFVSSGPAVGCAESLLICSATVDYKGCAAFLLVLQTDVNCQLINACLVYGDGVFQRIVGSVIAVCMCIRHCAAACTDLIIFHVVAVLCCILECIDTDTVIELFGECCGELQNVAFAVAVSVELGNNVRGGEYVIAVYALAVFDLVGVLVSDVAANGANAPSLFESCRVGENVYFIAVSFACGNFGSAANGASTVNKVVISYGDNFLSYKSFAANGALLAVGETGLGAACCLTGDNFLGVVKHGDNFLLYSDCAANGALLTVGETGFGAACCLAGDNFFGVVKCRDGFLRNKNFAALGTLLTVGKTGFLTGCFLTRNYFLGVYVFGGGRFGCSYFGSGGLRSGGTGLISRGNLRLIKQATGSNGQHHGNGQNQNQNAKNVLVFHLENLHKKFGAWLHGNIIS